MTRAARIMSGLFLAAVLAGCRSHLAPLPPDAGTARPPEPGLKNEPNPPPVSAEPAVPPAGASGVALPVLDGDGAFRPARDGEWVVSGVRLLAPAFDAAASTATFGVRNEAGLDLHDLILSVIFKCPPDDPGGSFRPRFETVEVPLAKGEMRMVRVSLTRREDGAPTAFRVAAGIPEFLARREEDRPGTTFLGGLLECRELVADLTAEKPTVEVGLAAVPGMAAAAALPPLEAQLLLARTGRLVWRGPWILLPRADAGNAEVRTVRWDLSRAPGVAGCAIYLRVREKR